VVSPSYFRLNAGGVAADVEDVNVTAIATPYVFSVTGVYAEASGRARRLPGSDIDFRTRILRLAAAIDLERAAGVNGLSLGLMGEVPGLTSDLRYSMGGGLTVAQGSEDREINLTLGAHWRGGTRDWFMVAAFLNAVRNRTTTEVAGIRQRGTLDAWFARTGVSLLPFVPLGLADGETPLAEWLGQVRFGTDVEYVDIASPGEGGRTDATAYFGADVRLVPDAWNPLSRWVRLVVISGIDTNRGWGLGAGLSGNGPLQFLSCNPGYSSRPLAPSLGRRVDIWSATCSVVWGL
jgi:hypothetical protein